MSYQQIESGSSEMLLLLLFCATLLNGLAVSPLIEWPLSAQECRIRKTVDRNYKNRKFTDLYDEDGFLVRHEVRYKGTYATLFEYEKSDTLISMNEVAGGNVMT